MSSKLSLLGSIGTGQAPTDLFYIDDISLGAAGSLSITLNDLFSLITRNITDGAVRFAAFAAPAVSAATQGAIYFDSGTNRLLFSENGGAYVRVGNVTGPAAATDEALARFDAATGRLLQNSAITLSDAGALTFPDDIRQVFNPGATVAGLNVGALAGDPATPINGDLWYDSTGNLLRARINGASISLAPGDVVGPAGATDEAIARFDGATGKLIQNSVVTISDTGVFSFPDDLRQTFNPGANQSGLNVGAQAGDPGTLVNGDVWYNSTTNLLRARVNGATFTVGNVTGPSGGATDEALTRFDGATGQLVQNSLITLSDAGALSFPDDVRQTFNPGTNNAGLNVGSLAGDVATPSNGDLWYNSTTNALRARINGANVSLGAGGGGTPGGANTEVQFNNAGAFGGVTGFTSDGTNVTAGSGNLRATNPQITTGIRDANGNTIILLTAVASAVNSIAVADSATGNSPELGVTGSDANLNLILSAKGTGVLTSAFPFTFTGSTTTSFATPAGSNVPTKVNIVSFDPGAFGQLISFGITSAVGSNRRVMSIFDQRAGAHDPSVALFAPDENNSFGGSWEGSNTEVSLKTTISAGVIRVQGGGTLAGKLMVIKPGTTYSAQAGIRSDDAARVALIVSTESTPSVDIAQFIINDNNSAGTYTGIAKGGTIFTPRNTVTGAGGGTTNLDFSKGNIQQFTFGAGNETLTFSNIPNSAILTIVIIQDGTGTRTLTWPGTAKFIAGVAPILSTTGNARDIINFYSDGTNIYQSSAIALAVA